jgi:hypothetical protein
MEIVTVGSALTITETGTEATMLGVLELSFTWSSKLHAPTVERVGETVGREEEVQGKEDPGLLYAVAPGASCSHWQVYEEVPPLNDDVVERVTT